MMIVIIGGGPGGTEVAFRAARAGHQVYIIERDRLGGTCTNHGCIPTKFLLAAVTQEIRKNGRVDKAAWEKIQARKKAMVDGLSRKIEKDLQSVGATVLKGKGELSGPREVAVTDCGGTTSYLSADAIILATGSAPALIPAFNMDGRFVLTSTEALELRAVPGSLAIIGSGFIGTEFAHLFNLLGTRVTLIEALPRILPGEDDDTSAVIRQEFEHNGVQVVTGTKVSAARAGGDGAVVELEDGRSFSAELALVSIGRRLNTDGLGLEKAGLIPDQRGTIAVNHFLETGVPGIYALGDVAGRMMLAHVAAAQGVVVAERLGGGNRAMEYRAVPYAVFGSPEVATVGLTERAARDLGMKYIKGKAPFSANIKARIDLKQVGFIKVLADPATGLLLGGTIVGPRAAEMIHALAVAIQADLTADEFVHCIFVHPTLSESLREAAENLS